MQAYHSEKQSVTWTVVRLTAAKFKPLVFSMDGFFLSNGTYIRIKVVLDVFWLKTDVTLRPTISRPVHHGVEPRLGLMTRY
jgi:hypothetical protein